MKIKPDEITSILKSRIEGLDAGSAELTEVGTVLSVGDGIARVHGLEDATPEKKEGLEKTLDGADETLVNFLELLIEKHRMPAIFRIRRYYDGLWEQENKILPVQISTATELDKATVKQIGDRIAKDTGQKIELTADVDPDILGGIVLRVGNSILDASIRNRLDNLRKHVARGA